jgi:hypothetical protein
MVRFPTPNSIQFSSAVLFADSHGPLARAFFERAFRAPGVVLVAIDSERRTGEIVLHAPLQPGDRNVVDLARLLSTTPAQRGLGEALVFPKGFARGSAKSVRLQRYGRRLSSWTVSHEIAGRVRLHHPGLYRSRELCKAVERSLANTVGIDRYGTNELTATVLISYDPQRIQKHRIVEILDATLA